MGSFTADALTQRLDRLSNTAESIQTVAQWLVYHRKRHTESVDVWKTYLYKNKSPDKKMLLMYLANEVMQTSRKKGGEFIKEFGQVLPNAILNLFRSGNEDHRGRMLRMLEIWEQRRVFPIEYVEDIRNALQQHAKPKPGASAAAGPPAPRAAAPAPGPAPAPAPASATSASPAQQVTHPLASALAQLEVTASVDQMISSKLEQLDFDQVIHEANPATRLAATTLLTQYKMQLESEMSRRQAAVVMLVGCLQEQQTTMNAIVGKHELCVRRLRTLGTSVSTGPLTVPPLAALLPQLAASAALSSAVPPTTTASAPHLAGHMAASPAQPTPPAPAPTAAPVAPLGAPPSLTGSAPPPLLAAPPPGSVPPRLTSLMPSSLVGAGQTPQQLAAHIAAAAAAAAAQQRGGMPPSSAAFAMLRAVGGPAQPPPPPPPPVMSQPQLQPPGRPPLSGGAEAMLAGSKRASADDDGGPAMKRPHVIAPGPGSASVPAPYSPSATGPASSAVPYTPTAAGMSPMARAGNTDVTEVDMDVGEGEAVVSDEEGSVFKDEVAPSMDYDPERPEES